MSHCTLRAVTAELDNLEQFLGFWGNSFGTYTGLGLDKEDPQILSEWLKVPEEPEQPCGWEIKNMQFSLLWVGELITWRELRHTTELMRKLIKLYFF